jgi:HD-like signal output (HDOD) protein
LANHSPFTHQTSWFNHFDDLHTLAVDELLALLCATCFYKQCINNESTAAEINLFYQGVCSGFINMQIAYKYGFNPLHCFLTPLIHHFSLVIIYRELNQQTQLPNAKCVLNEIDQIHLKLGYWIAKDWGLSDDILYPLRERFLREENALQCELIQKSEHAYIAIQFCHQNLLTRKETLALLKVMQLEEYDFFTQLASTH